LSKNIAQVSKTQSECWQYLWQYLRSHSCRSI